MIQHAEIIQSISQGRLLSGYELIYHNVGILTGEDDMARVHRGIEQVLLERNINYVTELDLPLFEMIQGIYEQSEKNKNPIFDVYIKDDELIVVSVTNGVNYTDFLKKAVRTKLSGNVTRAQLYQRRLFQKKGDGSLGGVAIILAYTQEVGFIEKYQSPKSPEIPVLDFASYFRVNVTFNIEN